MSALQQVTVTYLVFSGATPAVVTTATQVISIPAGVQSLDSTANTNTSAQTGFSSFDLMLASIAKGGGIRFVSSAGIATWIPIQQIVMVQGE